MSQVYGRPSTREWRRGFALSPIATYLTLVRGLRSSRSRRFTPTRDPDTTGVFEFVFQSKKLVQSSFRNKHWRQSVSKRIENDFEIDLYYRCTTNMETKSRGFSKTKVTNKKHKQVKRTTTHKVTMIYTCHCGIICFPFFQKVHFFTETIIMS